MNERYTNSLLDSIKKYLFNLEYLANDDKITLRALGTFKILHQLYSWADWFEVCEDRKIKMEQLINCIIMRNSNLVLPNIIPGPYYSNVSTPQTIYTWQKVYDMPNVQIHEDLDTDTNQRVTHYLAVQADNSGQSVFITVNNPDLINSTHGNTAFLRTYLDQEEVELAAPEVLSNGKTFIRWKLDGIDQPLGVQKLNIIMNSNKTATVQYADYIPITGSITINKIVTTTAGVEIDSDTLFEVYATNGNIIRSGFVKSGIPLIISDLPLGTYTISENPSLLHNIVSILPSSVTLTTSDSNKSTTIINAEKSSIGTITINKVVLLNGEVDPTDETNFPITISNGIVTLSGNVSQSTPLVFSNLSYGSYTIIENVPLYYQQSSITNSIVTITEESQNGSVTITNIYTPVVGSITISKIVKDEFGVVNPDDNTEFSVIVSNSTNSLWVGTVNNHTSFIINNLPIGEYIITESETKGYQLDSITSTPVIITEGNLIHNVEIINSKLPPLTTGSITINKRVENYTDVIKYGSLYNWYTTVDSRNIANIGWRMPTEQDWFNLRTHTGQSAYPYIETGNEYWNPPVTLATNATGFTARPSGYRLSSGTYEALGYSAFFWTSTEKSSTTASMFMLTNSQTIGLTTPDKRYGGAIRLVKNSTLLTDGQIGTYTGNDNKIYKTICIGTTEWVIENLNETKFRNQDLIQVVPSSAWTNLPTAGMCYYNNDIKNTTYRGIGLIPNETIFTTTITNSNGSLSQNIAYLTPAVFSNLDFDTYIITENQAVGYESPAIDIPSVTLSIDDPGQLVTITNTKTVEVGSITINKTVLNVSGDKEYSFQYVATGTGVNPLIFNAHGSTVEPAIFSNLPLDSYTITEIPDSDYPLISITPEVCTLTSLNPNQSVEVVNGNTNPVFSYGLLYNWWAANNENNIAANGWVLPTVGDYTNLGIALGGNAAAGGKMKVTGYTYWNSPNTAASNSSKFNAVGAGGRSDVSPSNFEQRLSYTSYWTANEFDVDKSSLIALSFSSGTLIIDQYASGKLGISKNNGISIRLRKINTSLLEGQVGTYVGNNKQVYNTICIGGIEWLSENLRETKYRTGDLIPNVTNGITWAGLRTGALCAYNNDPNNV